MLLLCASWAQAQSSYTVNIYADDVFRCPFYTRAEIALNAARNGDLSENMINGLPAEDRVKLTADINERIATLQKECPTKMNQSLQAAGFYAAGATSLVGAVGYLYSFVQVSNNYSSWILAANLAWAAEKNQHSNWQIKKPELLKDAALFRWETGKSALMLVGAVATYMAGSVVYSLLQNAAEQSNAQALELANLNASLELINALSN